MSREQDTDVHLWVLVVIIAGFLMLLYWAAGGRLKAIEARLTALDQKTVPWQDRELAKEKK